MTSCSFSQELKTYCEYVFSELEGLKNSQEIFADVCHVCFDQCSQKDLTIIFRRMISNMQQINAPAGLIDRSTKLLDKISAPMILPVAIVPCEGDLKIEDCMGIEDRIEEPRCSAEEEPQQLDDSSVVPAGQQHIECTIGSVQCSSKNSADTVTLIFPSKEEANTWRKAHSSFAKQQYSMAIMTDGSFPTRIKLQFSQRYPAVENLTLANMFIRERKNLF